ncbi:hypothetical protein D3C72_1524890 [compost metagenome]
MFIFGAKIVINCMSKGKRDYKIALVGDCLAGGGAEKVHAILSVFFESKGFSVHNIILLPHQ